jgi:formaldehyde-activating enzyme
MDILDRFAGRTRIGSALAGTGAHAVRVDVVVGRLGGPLEGPWLATLAGGRPGHAVQAVDLRPGLPVRPATLLVAPLEGRGSALPGLLAGPAQAAVAGSVVKAVEDGLLPREAADETLVLAVVDLEAGATDADEVFASVHAATHEALAAAAHGTPTIDEVLAEAGHPWNPGYHRHRN